MTRPQQLHVRVPASTSNLGSGFDVLGLALDIELEVRCLGPAAGGKHQLVKCTGTAEEWPNTPNNILFRAMDRVAEELSLEPIPLQFEVHSAIPVARGLGSSGAASAAGLLLGAEWYAREARRLTQLDLVRLGIELEGHPENSTASLLGGAVLCVPESDGSAHVVRQALAPELRFVVAWPNARVSTNKARAVLPKQVAFRDAVENPRRLALLLEGLRTGDPKLLSAGVRDALHVAYRLKLIQGGEEALRAAVEAGAHCATISGSGSTLIAICAEGEVAGVAAALEAQLAMQHDEVIAREVRPVLQAPVVRTV